MFSFKMIISGGGTGGHIFPAIAIANAVKQIAPEVEILFVGALGRMEMQKIPAAGFKIIGLPIMGFQRSLSLKNLKFPFMLIASLIRARRIVKNFQPDVAVGVGGYASGPLLNIAAKKGVPSLVQEQNSFAGITNRILGKKVNTICVAFDGMERFFPKEKIMLTGNPVRAEVVQIEGKKTEAVGYFGLEPQKKTLLVVGGSLGSWSINEGIELNLRKWSLEGFQIIWQTGKLFYERAVSSSENAASWVKVYEFIDRMDLAYAMADLVVSRAGAIAVSELMLVKKPCILVPLPTAAEDHQSMNAMALVEKDAAVLVKDNEVKGRLGTEVSELIKNENKLKKISDNMQPLGFKNAANAIAEEIIKLVKNR